MHLTTAFASLVRTSCRQQKSRHAWRGALSWCGWSNLNDSGYWKMPRCAHDLIACRGVAAAEIEFSFLCRFIRFLPASAHGRRFCDNDAPNYERVDGIITVKNPLPMSYSCYVACDIFLNLFLQLVLYHAWWRWVILQLFGWWYPNSEMFSTKTDLSALLTAGSTSKRINHATNLLFALLHSAHCRLSTPRRCSNVALVVRLPVLAR